jgi:hypothetical protein
LHGRGLKTSEQLGDVRGRKKQRLVARRSEDGGDFPQSETGPLKGFRFGKF